MTDYKEEHGVVREQLALTVEELQRELKLRYTYLYQYIKLDRCETVRPSRM